VDLSYSHDRPVTAEVLARLYDRAGLRRPTGDLARMQRMIDDASVLLSVWAADQLIGVARAVTDWSFCCYLSDLAVDPDWQRQGIGRELIRRLRELLGADVRIILLAAPSAKDYYGHLGFDHLDNAWSLPGTR